MRLKKEKVGTIREKDIFLFTLENSNGYRMKVLSYGATVTEFWMPDKEGKNENILVSAKSWKDYPAYRPFYGSAIGPVAGRIAGGQFELNGKMIQLEQNEGKNHLHGGTRGWDTAIW